MSNVEGTPGWPECSTVSKRVEWDLEATNPLATISSSGLRVFAVTYNMHGTLPSADVLSAILQPGAHVYAIGTEECERSIAQSLVIASKERWEGRIAEALGSQHVKVASQTLAAVHLAVYVHRSLLPVVSDVQSGSVACGVGNRVGNKGGVGVGMTVGKTSLLFVNCHLAAHTRNVKRRNADFARIDALLPLAPAGTTGVEQLLQSLAAQAQAQATPPTSTALQQAAASSSSTAMDSDEEDDGGASEDEDGSGEATPALPALQPATAAGGAAAGTGTSRVTGSTASTGVIQAQTQAQGGAGGASSRYDRVFWMGDMNYRINGSRSVVDSLLASGSHEVLLANDQLLRERRKGKVAQGFHEGPLCFAPTYKLDRVKGEGSVNSVPLIYDSGPKARVPAWTDRILFKSAEDSLWAEAEGTVGNKQQVQARYSYPQRPNATPSSGPSSTASPAVDLSIGPGPVPAHAIPGITLHAYGAVFAVRTSDHVPVTAAFTVRLRGDHARRRSSVSGGSSTSLPVPAPAVAPAGSTSASASTHAPAPVAGGAAPQERTGAARGPTRDSPQDQQRSSVLVAAATGLNITTSPPISQGAGPWQGHGHGHGQGTVQGPTLSPQSSGGGSSLLLPHRSFRQELQSSSFSRAALAAVGGPVSPLASALGEVREEGEGEEGGSRQLPTATVPKASSLDPLLSLTIDTGAGGAAKGKASTQTSTAGAGAGAAALPAGHAHPPLHQSQQARNRTGSGHGGGGGSGITDSGTGSHVHGGGGEGDSSIVSVTAGGAGGGGGGSGVGVGGSSTRLERRDTRDSLALSRDTIVGLSRGSLPEFSLRGLFFFASSTRETRSQSKSGVGGGAGSRTSLPLAKGSSGSVPSTSNSSIPAAKTGGRGWFYGRGTASGNSLAVSTASVGGGPGSALSPSTSSKGSVPGLGAGTGVEKMDALRVNISTREPSFRATLAALDASPTASEVGGPIDGAQHAGVGAGQRMGGENKTESDADLLSSSSMRPGKEGGAAGGGGGRKWAGKSGKSHHQQGGGAKTGCLSWLSKPASKDSKSSKGSKGSAKVAPAPASASSR